MPGEEPSDNVAGDSGSLFILILGWLLVCPVMSGVSV
jgi:hypothetical protein